MHASGVRRVIENMYPLPHIEYHKNEPKIFIHKEKENEDSERDSSGHSRTDDA
tara:strand:+ start:62952 stop:63110 length:159 start_codon:yes stop_codon:yes gene_type:complete